MSDKFSSTLPKQLGFQEDFPPVLWDEWRARVDKDLKGDSFEKKLVTQTYEGFSIPPVVSAETQVATASTAPFWKRDHRSYEDRKQGWDTRSLVAHPDASVANKQALQELAKGATSVQLNFAVNGGDERRIHAHRIDDIEDALEGVRLDWAPVALSGGSHAALVAAAAHSLVDKQGLKGTDLSGCFHIDPLGQLATDGSLPTSLETALKQAADVAAYTVEKTPEIRTLTVDTSAYHHAGAHEAQDLGIAMATGVAYLRALEEAGLSVETAASQIQFVFRLDSHFLKGISKLRAARQLWSRILVACGLSESDASMKLQILPSERALTQRDPWVNMLRNTVVCFVGAVAGADVVTPVSFDTLLGLENETGRRVARNTSLILQEEANLHKVTDPAGGSWLLEQMTTELLQRGWAFFQQIEQKGGIASALTSNWLQAEIASVQAARQAKLSKRRDPLTGVSEFANLSETLPTPAKLDREQLNDRRGMSSMMMGLAGGTAEQLQTALHSGEAGAWTALLKQMAALNPFSRLTDALAEENAASCEALKSTRFAEGFEALRDKSDQWLEANGKRPQVFLASLGSLPTHNPRTTFTRNFLAAGGFEGLVADTASQSYDSVESAKEAFVQSGSTIAILCSSDKVYAEQAVEVAQALKDAGAERIWLAGRPGDQKDEWAEAGMDGYLYLGCDVLGQLSALWSYLEESK